MNLRNSYVAIFSPSTKILRAILARPIYRQVAYQRHKYNLENKINIFDKTLDLSLFRVECTLVFAYVC